MWSYYLINIKGILFNPLKVSARFLILNKLIIFRALVSLRAATRMFMYSRAVFKFLGGLHRGCRAFRGTETVVVDSQPAQNLVETV